MLFLYQRTLLLKSYLSTPAGVSLRASQADTALVYYSSRCSKAEIRARHSSVIGNERTATGSNPAMTV